jgi:succinate dehydrogenase / fumarate reductase iron-sulfur subunit
MSVAVATPTRADAAAAKRTVRFRIRRQDGPSARPYWQEFDVPHTPGMNVIAALMEIRRNPVTADGQQVAPVAWEASCLEEVCGICSMRINGRPRQACAAIVDRLKQPVTLEPLGKFPCVRDLVVDRARMFEYLKRAKAWIPIDGTYDLGPGPRYDDALRQWQYELSKCFTCGICLEVCPNYGPQSTFMGAQVINQVVRFNLHPTGRMYAGERLEAMMGEGGVLDCGNAQNCVQSCPKGIPLTESIAELKRETLVYSLAHWSRRR